MQTHMKARAESYAHAWLARLAPLTDRAGRVRGVCVTAHDFTEQFRARERLQLVNEASMRIGTTLDVTRTAQELADVCRALAGRLRQRGAAGSGVRARACRRPAVRAAGVAAPRRPAVPCTAGTCRRASRQVGEVVVYPENSPQADSLVAGHSVVASVPAGDLDPWLAVDETRARRFEEYGVHAMLSVPLQARGTTLGVAAFTRFNHPEAFTRPRRAAGRGGHRARRRLHRQRPPLLAGAGDHAHPPSAVCCPGPCRARPPWRPPPAICRPHAPGWAATGST
ncbi:hypothetical protein STENM223S_07524 [Streptomyces tendae]